MIKHILEFSISEDVRKQDTAAIMIAIAKSKAGRELSWNFFRENFTFLKNRFVSSNESSRIQMIIITLYIYFQGSGLGSKLIKGVVEDFATEDKAQEVIDFFKANMYSGTDRAIQQGVESIRMNEAWLKRERNLPALQDYLEADAF